MSKNDPPLRTLAYRRIKSDLARGKYLPRQRLVEEEIAKGLKISRTPVRDAIRLLEVEGLVEVDEHKGARVVSVSIEEVKERYEMRAVLEGWVSRLAATRADKEQIAELSSLIDAAEKKLPDDPNELISTNGEFHAKVAEVGGNAYIARCLKQNRLYLSLFRMTSLFTVNRVASMIQEHRAILEAIEVHDADEAEARARNHVISAANVAVKNVQVFLNQTGGN